jgi:hypothetical protein
MDTASATAILTAMITPAVLISACGSMILSTSSRLGRVVDRVRALSDRFEEISKDPGDMDSRKERQAAIFEQLDKLTSRSRILQRSMVAFYLGLGMFVATSVAIGVVAIPASPRYTIVPVVLGLLGASFLFYGSILLIFEARWRSVPFMRRWILSGANLRGLPPLTFSNSINHILFISGEKLS